MPYYISNGEFQKQLKEYYTRYGHTIHFPEMVKYLYDKHLLRDDYQVYPEKDLYDDLSDEAFENLLDLFPLTIPDHLFQNDQLEVKEGTIIPDNRDVMMFRHFYYTQHHIHKHNYFEVNYILKGKCFFEFQDHFREMQAGELCIIAPDSKHDLSGVGEDSTIISICIKKSTFNTTFFSLMSQKDLLSHFFRTMLYDNSQANYLMFFTENSEAIKKVIKNLIIENLKNDPYSNNCCISWTNLLFAIVLRNYGDTIQFYQYESGTDFTLVLQYIKHNYRDLSLSDLATLFHYSTPYLSTLIQKNTGHSFSFLIKQLKMSDAIDFLINTNMKVSEIATEVGYNSADHFSRVFRSAYNISPQNYRKQYNNNIEFK